MAERIRRVNKLVQKRYGTTGLGSSGKLNDEIIPVARWDFRTDRDKLDKAVNGVKIGSQLTVNGTFDTDLSDWFIGGEVGAITWNDGRVHFLDLAGTNASLQQLNKLTIGKYYKIEVDIVDYVSGDYGITNDSTEVSFNVTGDRKYTLVFLSTTTTIHTRRIATGGAYDFKVDNIEVYELADGWQDSAPVVGQGSSDDINNLVQPDADKVPIHTGTHLVFDGSNDVMAGLPIVSDDFTYVMKIHFDNLVTSTLIGHSTGNAFLGISSLGVLRYRVDAGGIIDIPATFVPNVDYIIALRRQNGLISIFIDGVLLHEEINDLPFNVDSLGGRVSNFTPFEGSMEYVAVYDMAMADPQILRERDALTTRPTPLLAYNFVRKGNSVNDGKLWKNGGSTSTTNDLIQNVADSVPTSLEGFAGLGFDGIDDDYNAGRVTANGEMTIIAQFSVDNAAGTTMEIVRCKNAFDDPRGFYVGINTLNNIVARGSGSLALLSSPVADNTPLLCVFAFRGAQVDLWVNGVKVGSGAVDPIVLSEGEDLHIGSRLGIGGFFKGSMGFIGVYDTALSEGQIALLFARAR